MITFCWVFQHTVKTHFAVVCNNSQWKHLCQLFTYASIFVALYRVGVGSGVCVCVCVSVQVTIVAYFILLKLICH